LNALATDTRSIGQVLYEATKQPGWPSWIIAGQSVRDRHERAAELVFHRGFKAGIEAQKLADPPPKAKELKLQLAELGDAARDFMQAQHANNVGRRVAARERLVKALGDKP
jgi:hypothetical protein